MSSVERYYDSEAEGYDKYYSKDFDGYPANQVRLKITVDLLSDYGILTVLDCGCGSGAPLVEIISRGWYAEGFDFSKEMVKSGKELMKNNGFNSNKLYLGDVVSGEGMPNKRFDVVLAFGVLPHIENEKKALRNMSKRLSKNGKMLVEFRNELFSFFTFNGHSKEFYSKLIGAEHLPKDIKTKALAFFANRLNADKKKHSKSKKNYDKILAKFHNPLTIGKLFDSVGLKVTNIYFYHFHALPPVFEDFYPKEFRKLSLALENKNDWRGYFMASAFMVEAEKK